MTGRLMKIPCDPNVSLPQAGIPLDVSPYGNGGAWWYFWLIVYGKQLTRSKLE